VGKVAILAVDNVRRGNLFTQGQSSFLTYSRYAD